MSTCSKQSCERKKQNKRITTSATRRAEPATKMRVGDPFVFGLCERRSRRLGVTECEDHSVPHRRFFMEGVPLAMKSGNELRVLSSTHGDVSTIAFSDLISIHNYLIIVEVHPPGIRISSSSMRDNLENDFA